MTPLYTYRYGYGWKIIDMELIGILIIVQEGGGNPYMVSF